MKTKTQITLFSLLIFIFQGCNNNGNATIKNSDDSPYPNRNSFNETKDDKKKIIEERVSDLLYWYKQKYDTISTINFVNIPDSAHRIYEVNFNSTEEYLKVLKKSNFFTQSFIDQKRKYFKECNENMIKNKQNDGPPDGLDYDLILLTQEIDETLNSINKVTFSNYIQTENKASIEVQMELVQKLRVHLIKEDTQWQVDKIALVL